MPRFWCCGRRRPGAAPRVRARSVRGRSRPGASRPSRPAAGAPARAHRGRTATAVRGWRPRDRRRRSRARPGPARTRRGFLRQGGRECSGCAPGPGGRAGDRGGSGGCVGTTAVGTRALVCGDGSFVVANQTVRAWQSRSSPASHAARVSDSPRSRSNGSTRTPTVPSGSGPVPRHRGAAERLGEHVHDGPHRHGRARVAEQLDHAAQPAHGACGDVGHQSSRSRVRGRKGAGNTVSSSAYVAEGRLLSEASLPLR